MSQADNLTRLGVEYEPAALVGLQGMPKKVRRHFPQGDMTLLV